MIWYKSTQGIQRISVAQFFHKGQPVAQGLQLGPITRFKGIVRLGLHKIRAGVIDQDIRQALVYAAWLADESVYTPELAAA